jgi:ribonuclease D
MVTEPAILPILVETSEALVQLGDELCRQRRVAVDTESNSLHAYRERVCLIQFSTEALDYVLDPLALDSLNPLRSMFADERIEKIFHASEYDVICLRRDYGFSFTNLFDTMQAARILGRKRAGLDGLLDEKLGVKINKWYQKADWGVRPISRELLRYAVLDTHYLIPLRDLLEVELKEKELWELAQEDFRMACSANGQKPKAESPAWARMSAHRDLTARDLTVLKELFSCREEIAARLDRPSFKVLDDEQLVEIAKAEPATLEELKSAGLTTRQLEYWGNRIIDAVARGLESPLLQKTPPRAPTGAYLKRLERLKAWRRKVAAGMDVESDVVLPRSLLLTLAEYGSTDLSSVMGASPWRLRHFGEQISEILQTATS